MSAPKQKAAAEVFREQNQIAVPPPAPAMAPPPMPISQAPLPEMNFDENRQSFQPQQPKMKAASIPGFKTSEELQNEKDAPRVRETGILWWKRIIVPPNVYVVHTRLGRKEPVTIGLGVSFRYNPYSDSYLVVPAAMQTIGVVANCISREKQGINVLAYVQWQIQDFAVAYRRLDFSDQRDPLGIVNAQMREQAEAAIKDKIATMSIEDVLTDKEPIIEELTTRLKQVAEGRGGDEGLGIKIVTVQIKEAVVSSQRLWEHLQMPFRVDKEKSARLSQLEAQEEIRQKELTVRQATETSEAETAAAIERIKQAKQTEATEIRIAEESARFTREQESLRSRIQLEEQTSVIERESQNRLTLEQARLNAEAAVRQKTLEVEKTLQVMAEETRLEAERLRTQLEELQRKTELLNARTDYDLLSQQRSDEFQAEAQRAQHSRQLADAVTKAEIEETMNRVKLALLEREAEIARIQQDIRNLVTSSDITRRLIDQLPQLAEHMPDIEELRVVQAGDYNSLAAFLTQVRAIAGTLGVSFNGNGTGSDS